MSSDQASNLAKSIQNKMNIVKIVGAIVVVSTLTAGGYYAYKKLKSDGTSGDKSTTGQVECPPGQSYNSTCGYCTPECGENATYNCLTNKCECPPGLVGDANELCICPNNTYPNSSGTCSSTGEYVCPIGQQVCPWDPQNCYTIQGTCAASSIIDPNTGRFLPNAKIPVPCGTGTVCVTPGSRAYNLAMAANPGILDNLCRSVTCQCSNPSTCSFPECGANPQRFIGWNNSEQKCVIERDCKTVPSKYSNLVTGSVSRSCLVQQPDPVNPAICADLSYSQLKNICELDSNGCEFGYTYNSSSGFCQNVSGQTAARGSTGCRASGDNTQMIGYNCALFNTEYSIVPSINTATSSQITGELYLNNSTPVKNVSLWEYAIFRANPSSGKIEGSVFSTGYFIPFRSGTKTITNPTTGGNVNYPNYTYNISISGIGNNPYLSLGNYRILFSGYQENNGIFNMVYASASNGSADYQLSGDLFIVSVLDNPVGLAASLMVIPTSSASQSVITNLGKSNIISNVFSNNKSENIPQTTSLTGQFEMIPYQGLSYGLISCDNNLCGEILNQMTVIIAWNSNNITVPTGKYLKYYVTRINPPPLTTEDIINVSSVGSLYYIGDLQPINNTFIYEIRTVLADTASEIITPASYQTYYSRGEASAPRQLAVYLPQYTAAICNSVPINTPPLFSILVNPVSGNFLGYSTTNLPTVPTVNGDVSMVISTGLNYQPNYYATITSRNDSGKFFVIRVLTYSSYTGVLTGKVTEVAGSPSGSDWHISMANGGYGQGGYCMRPQLGLGAVNSYNDWYCNARYGGPTGTSRNLTSFGQIGSTGTIYLWNQNANGCVPVLPNKTPTVKNYSDIMNNKLVSPTQITNPQQWINGIDVNIDAGCGCVGSECPPQGVTSMFSYGGDIIASNAPPGTTGNYNDLKSRLIAADTFGVQYVNGWQGSQGTIYNNMVNNLYECPLASNPNYYNSAANCAPGDSNCTALANKLNCAQNNCSTLQPNVGSSNSSTYSETVTWLPDLSGLTTTRVNELACNSKGTYTRGRGVGTCTCNFGFGGPNCAGVSILPNSTGCIGAVNGICGENAFAAPEQCALYVSATGANNPRRLQVPNALQKFVPSAVGGQGCVINYNPLAWADVTGVAAHSDQGRDGWLCKNAGFKGSLGVRGSIKSSEWYDYSRTSNACGITPSDLNSSITAGSWNSPMTDITYDFSKVKPNSLPVNLVGPYAGVEFNEYSRNSSIVQNIKSSNNQVNMDSNNYLNTIFGWELNAIGAAGNSPGDVVGTELPSLDINTISAQGGRIIQYF